MRCMGVHIACMTSGGRVSKRIIVVQLLVDEENSEERVCG